MNDKPLTPFAPFASPPPPMFEGPVQPTTPTVPPPKRKRSNKKPAIKAKTLTESKATKREKPARDRHAVAAEAPAKRKTRGASKGKRPPKFELSQILRIAAGLKESDRALFETLLVALTGAPKAARRRALTALGQVFE